MRILEVISNLLHQVVLVVRGELRTTLLVAARELVHLHSFYNFSAYFIGRR